MREWDASYYCAPSFLAGNGRPLLKVQNHPEMMGAPVWPGRLSKILLALVPGLPATGCLEGIPQGASKTPVLFLLEEISTADTGKATGADAQKMSFLMAAMWRHERRVQHEPSLCRTNHLRWMTGLRFD